MSLLTRVQRAVTEKPPGVVSAAFWIALFLVVPTLIRLAMDPVLGEALWFPTYYPAALIATLFLGWRSGVVLLVLASVMVNYLFMPPRFGFALDQRAVAGTLVFALAQAVIVFTAALLRAALIRLEAANARERVLNQELQHRMKNTLAVIQGLVSQTVKRGGADPKAFQAVLQGRLEALSRGHDLLATGRWEMCELPELAARALEPFREHGGLQIEGPACRLRPECCVPLVLALHELATNAVKYGALSVDQGRVDLTWEAGGQGDAETIQMRWVERGGPPVTKPSRRGLGARLLTRQVGLEDVSLQFRPEGVECEIAVRRAGDRSLATNRPAHPMALGFGQRRARPETLPGAGAET